MDKYVKPEMEIVKFDVEDVITTSDPTYPPQPPWYDDELD